MLNNKRLGVDRALVQDASAALEQFLQDHKKEYKKSNPGPTTNDPTFVYRYRLCANVELAENQLTSPGCIVMLNTLMQHKVQCKALRLYRNCIDDVAVCRLSQMLADQNEAIEELHLSNNRITERGIMQLLMTFALHPNHAYPWQAKSQFYQPTWLRMENNNISKPQEMLEVLTETGKLILCIADDKSGCGPSKCVHAFKEQKPSPIAHLHMYDVHPNASPQGLLSKEEMVKIASCKSYDEIKKLPPPKSGPVMSISGHTLPQAASNALSAFIGGNAAALTSGATSSQTHSATQTGKRCPSGGGGVNTAAGSGASSGTVKGAWPAASRPSGPASDTVIHRYQLVNLLPPNDCSEEAVDLSHCICGRCNNVLKDPIQARPCRHRFCRNCFQAHMERFTIPAKQKNQPVTSIPCPSCDLGLARSDVGGLDEKTLREYRQTRVRCKHHPVNFVSPLYLAEKAAAEGALGSGERSAAESGGDGGKGSSSTASGNPPSELVKTALGIECRWQGTVSEYAAHIHQCQVEEIVRDQMAPRADFASVVRNKSATSNVGGSTPSASAAAQQQGSGGGVVSPTALRDKGPGSPSSGQRRQAGSMLPAAADVTSDSTTTATTRTEPPGIAGLGPLPTASLGMIEAAASIAAAVEGELKNSAPKVYEAMAMGANDTLVESGTLPPTSDWSPNSKASTRRSKPPMTPLSRMGEGDDGGERQGYMERMPPPLRQEDRGVYATSSSEVHPPGQRHGQGYFYDQRLEGPPLLPPQQRSYHQTMGPSDYVTGPPPQQHSYSNQMPPYPAGYDHHHHQGNYDNGGYHQFNGVGGGGPAATAAAAAPQHFMPGGYEDEASRRRREFEAIAAAATAAHQYPTREYDSHHYHHQQQQQQKQQQQSEPDTRAVNEYRRIVHDFVPDPETMNVGNSGSFLDLCAGDVVRVLEVTASGWAAGMRVDEDWRDIPHPQTGSTAWFPYSFSVAIER